MAPVEPSSENFPPKVYLSPCVCDLFPAITLPCACQKNRVDAVSFCYFAIMQIPLVGIHILHSASVLIVLGNWGVHARKINFFLNSRCFWVPNFFCVCIYALILESHTLPLSVSLTLFLSPDRCNYLFLMSQFSCNFIKCKFAVLLPNAESVVCHNSHQ